MRLKSYYAGTVESAICLARQEMGEDAMLVNSRKAQPEARHLGVYEVVFAAAQEPVREAITARSETPAARPRKTEEPSQPAVSQSMADEMSEMRRQLARISGLVARSLVRGGRTMPASRNASIDDFDQALSSHGVTDELTGEILRNLETSGSTADVRNAFRKEVGSRLNIAAELSAWSPETGAGASSAIVALVGPPGVGKTAMLAKLAMRYGISQQRSTHILSFDSHRIACGEQLRSYATILGVGFEALETVSGLAQSIKENSRKELLLIDTPGYSAADFDLSGDLTQFLSTYPHVDIHLVLSCAAKTSDISRMVDRYSIFGPAKLLFTRLDETSSYGVILNESVRTGLPVSFLGTGPGIPDDLEPATQDRIIDYLLEGRESRSVAAA